MGFHKYIQTGKFERGSLVNAPFFVLGLSGYDDNLTLTLSTKKAKCDDAELFLQKISDRLKLLGIP